MIEKTLVVFKPDAMQRGLVGEILSRFEKVGLKMVGAKIISPEEDFFHHHYEGIGEMIKRRGEEAFQMTVEMMLRGPVLALVLEGIEAVEVVRKMAGPTEPKTALPGTIRGDFAHISFSYADEKGKAITNLIHASGNKEEAEKEIAHWFKDDELFDYTASHEDHTR